MYTSFVRDAHQCEVDRRNGERSPRQIYPKSAVGTYKILHAHLASKYCWTIYKYLCLYNTCLYENPYDKSIGYINGRKRIKFFFYQFAFRKRIFILLFSRIFFV